MKLVLFAITIGRNLTKFWQKNTFAVFETRCTTSNTTTKTITITSTSCTTVSSTSHFAQCPQLTVIHIVIPVAWSKQPFWKVHGNLCSKFEEDLSKIVVTILFTDEWTDVGDFLPSSYWPDWMSNLSTFW